MSSHKIRGGDPARSANQTTCSEQIVAWEFTMYGKEQENKHLLLDLIRIYNSCKFNDTNPSIRDT